MESETSGPLSLDSRCPVLGCLWWSTSSSTAPKSKWTFPSHLFSQDRSYFILLSLSVKDLHLWPSLRYFCVPLRDMVPHWHLAWGYEIFCVCLQAICLDSSSHHSSRPAQLPWRVWGFSMRLATSSGSWPVFLCGLGYPQDNFSFTLFLPVLDTHQGDGHWTPIQEFFTI